MKTVITARSIREDLISLRGTSSMNNKGKEIIAGVEGKKIKVYDAGYEFLVAGLHCFYFGTTDVLTTKAFGSRKIVGGDVSKQFNHPRVGAVGDGLWAYAAVDENGFMWDVGYVQE